MNRQALNAITLLIIICIGVYFIISNLQSPIHVPMVLDKFDRSQLIFDSQVRAYGTVTKIDSDRIIFGKRTPVIVRHIELYLDSSHVHVGDYIYISGSFMVEPNGSLSILPEKSFGYSIINYESRSLDH